jgi:sugar lactone lactonase YvrE
MRRTATRIAALSFAALLAYLLLAPVPVEPVAWQAPANPGFTGVFAANTGLAKLERIDLGGATGPEHVALGPDGRVYASVSGGAILRMRPDGSAREVWARTGGQPLGFDFAADGRMIVTDAVRGLLAIDPAPSHQVTVLANRLPDGDPIRFPDAVTVAPDGSIYFTDASRRFAPSEHGGPFEASLLDIIEHQPTGRVLVYRPGGTVEVVADGLSFANGIAMSRDGQAVFVAESGLYRVWRIAANARKLDLRRGASTEARVVLDNLPGFPDNLMRGMNGRIWLGLAAPRTASADAVANSVFLRKLALRLPRFLWPVPPAYGHVLAFTEDGQIVADLQDPAGNYPDTTGVLETADRLYIQSVRAPSLGWLSKAGAGL